MLGTRWYNFWLCIPTMRAKMHSVTERWTDGGRTDGRRDDANSRSYCVTVRSAKKTLGVYQAPLKRATVYW